VLEDSPLYTYDTDSEFSASESDIC
jgi:hypothetical protein